MINRKSYFRPLVFSILIAILSIFNIIPSVCFATTIPSITVYCSDFNPCAGTPVVFTAAISGTSSNVVYQWQVNGVNSGTDNATFTFLNSVNAPIKSTDVIQCIITDQANNQTAVSNKLSNITVVVPTKLMFNIFSQTTLPVCSGTEVDFGTTYTNLQEAHINNIRGVWKVNGVFVNAGLTFTSTTLKDGDVVSCTATFTLKCGPPVDVEATSIKVSILNSTPPAVAVTPVDPVGCANSVLAFKATLANGSGYDTYQWMVNGNKAGTNSATFASSVLKTGDVVVCSVKTRTNCAVYNVESNQVAVTIVPQQNNSVTITSDAVKNFIEKNQEVTFTAQAGYTNNISYQWMVNGVDAGGNSKVFIDKGLTIGDVVTCAVTTTDPCVLPAIAMSNAVLILMHVPLQIPNVFTPNNDGINDNWVITALLIYPTCTVKIFDRYGSQVFNSIGYTSPWTGTSNGRRLPAGVYYYLINLNNGSLPLSGSVTIVR